MTNLLQRVDPAARAAGYISWNCTPYQALAGAVVASQEVDVVGLPVPFYVPIGNICLNVSTAGVTGTPTHFFVGIGNGTKLLAKSAELNADAQLTSTGIKKFPLSAPYTPVPSDSPSGFFYVCILEDRTADFTTPVQFARTGGIIAPPTGGVITAGRAGTAQTALPAAGGAWSTAMAAAGGQNFWVGLMP